MTIASSNPTIPVRKGEDLDWPTLDRYLKSILPHLEGEPEISQFAGGKSNLTYRLKYTNDDLVVRRPPFGTKAKTAHSMIREYTVMNRLRPVYPAVPETLHYTDDEAVIGAEFYVMRRVEGRKVSQTIPEHWQFSARDTRRLCERFWKKLIELHQVRYHEAGLGEFGRPAGYAERQVKGWNRRYCKAMTPDVDAFEDVQEWLEEHVPGDAGFASVLHGDFRMDNVVLNTDDPCTIEAVLDWEISALGDPFMDLGNALAYWVQADDPGFLKGLQLQPSDAPGMLTRREILDLYGRKTGRDIPDFTFYYTYGMFRNIVIIQQIYYRYFHAQTSDERFAKFGLLVGQLGNYCRSLIREKNYS